MPVTKPCGDLTNALERLPGRRLRHQLERFRGAAPQIGAELIDQDVAQRLMACLGEGRAGFDFEAEAGIDELEELGLGELGLERFVVLIVCEPLAQDALARSAAQDELQQRARPRALLTEEAYHIAVGE